MCIRDRSINSHGITIICEQILNSNNTYDIQINIKIKSENQIQVLAVKPLNNQYEKICSFQTKQETINQEHTLYQIHITIVNLIQFLQIQNIPLKFDFKLQIFNEEGQPEVIHIFKKLNINIYSFVTSSEFEISNDSLQQEFENQFITIEYFEQCVEILQKFFDNIKIDKKEKKCNGKISVYLAQNQFNSTYEIKIEENFTKIKINLIDCNNSLEEQKEISNNLFKLFQLLLMN
eukprot:TRINITY_DN11782_c0_g1_i2.p1 TRINITY_DN11782_c0_g1~~TRINITY_DN11782_c0_g1_i2.p1  ORF type:complete len:234 (-),score=35.83 TRINITY_DN11782_c0_g1_i2:55-756(-)